MIPYEREPELHVHVPRKYKCSSPYCLKATRCPGEPCKDCRHAQEQMRKRWRLLRATKERAL